MIIDHLMSLGSFVDILDLAGYFFDALRVWEDRLFELLEPAVRKTHVVKDVGFKGGVGPEGQCSFELAEAFLVF